MNKAFLTGFASLMLAATLSAPALALTVGGVDIPDTYTADSTELQLNGAGTRSKFFIDLYVGSLYVPQAGRMVMPLLRPMSPRRSPCILRLV